MFGIATISGRICSCEMFSWSARSSMPKRLSASTSATLIASRWSCQSSGRSPRLARNDQRAFSHAEQVAERTAEQLPGETAEAVAGEAKVELAIETRSQRSRRTRLVVVRPEDEEGLVESRATADLLRR